MVWGLRPISVDCFCDLGLQGLRFRAWQGFVPKNKGKMRAYTMTSNDIPRGTPVLGVPWFGGQRLRLGGWAGFGLRNRPLGSE